MPGEPYDGLLTPQAFLDARERMDGDAGKCPTCGSDRCVGRLQYENCDRAALPPVASKMTVQPLISADEDDDSIAALPPVAPDGADLDVGLVKQAITNIAKRHHIVKDPVPPQSLLSIYGYSTAPADMDAEIAAEYRRLRAGGGGKG